MSGVKTPFDLMGMTNNYWGICGINSSLYALYQNNPALQARLAKGAITPSMMLAELKTFLRLLQAEGKQGILDEITAFTKTFKNFENFSVQSYIERINDAAASVDSAAAGGGAQIALLNDPMFSIGLPPSAVVYYLQRICGFDKARLVGLDSAASELVLGLFRDDGTNMTVYGGLRHYVYYLNGVYYSWAKQFASIDQMQRNYGGICYKIAL